MPVPTAHSRRHHRRLRALRAAVRLLAAALALSAGTTASAVAAAKPKAPRLTALRCVPATSAACKAGVRIEVGDDVALKGQRLARGQKATFKWSKGKTTGKVRRAPGAWLVRVPAGTKAGIVSVSVKDRRGRTSNRKRLKVIAQLADPAPGGGGGGPAATTGPAVGRNAVPKVFEGPGLWVVDLPEADGGGADALIARARASGAQSILLRLPDAGRGLGEFSSSLVASLKAGGVRLCAWQYVFGIDAEAEAAAAVEAVKAGAACLVINAEEEYKGKYADAQRYIDLLRSGVGADYPVGLTSFPRPKSHPDVPLSVFLGPGGAQVNMPQVYWPTAKTTAVTLSIDAARGNRIYGRPLAPLGETAGATFDEVQAFRSLWAGFGAVGLGWYRWRDASPEVWRALGEATPAFDAPAEPGWERYGPGDSGDGVRWLQRHLAAFDASVTVDGVYGAGTTAAVRAFQTSRGLPNTGAVADQTWPKLLELTPKAG